MATSAYAKHALRDEHDSCGDACYDVIHGVRPPVVLLTASMMGTSLSAWALVGTRFLKLSKGKGFTGFRARALPAIATSRMLSATSTAIRDQSKGFRPTEARV